MYMEDGCLGYLGGASTKVSQPPRWNTAPMAGNPCQTASGCLYSRVFPDSYQYGIRYITHSTVPDLCTQEFFQTADQYLGIHYITHK